MIVLRPTRIFNTLASLWKPANLLLLFLALARSNCQDVLIRNCQPNATTSRCGRSSNGPNRVVVKCSGCGSRPRAGIYTHTSSECGPWRERTKDFGMLNRAVIPLERERERFWHTKSSGDPTFPMSRGTKLNYRICTLYFLSYTFGWWWESRTPRHSRSKNQVTSRAWHHAVRLMMVSLLTICQFARADSSLGANLARAFYIISKGRSTNDRGEPAVSYKWTGWSSRLQENYRSL